MAETTNEELREFLNPQQQEYPERKLRYQDVSPGVIGGELLFGVIDEEGVNHRDFIIQEMSGVEEDIYSQQIIEVAQAKDRSRKRMINIARAFTRIVTNCLTKLGTVEDEASINRLGGKITQADREYLILMARIATLGEIYEFDHTCNSDTCNHTTSFSVNLTDLPVSRPEDPSKRRYQIDLGREHEATWEVASYADEKWGLSQDEDTLTRYANTMYLLQRVRELDGVELKRDSKKDMVDSMKALQALPVSCRSKLRGSIRSNDSGVDTSLELECDECGFVSQGQVQMLGKDFLFPSEL